ncbi:MAG: ATP-binding protein [Actinomycetota bacterium]|nr:ATP-binding protein [Actinomycetota bacterium]
MPTPPSTRSVKIDSDERGGWSSDRPRRDGAPPRPADVTVRGRVLTPTGELRYSPGSLLVIVSGSSQDRDDFARRVIEEPSSVLSLDKVRRLLAGRVPDEEIEERAVELLDAAVLKRLEAGETVVVPAAGVTAAEREHYVRLAAPHRRPCHLILIEAARERISDEHSPAALNKLRSALDAGQLGAEGFNTSLRLGGSSIGELKRIAFRPASRDD